MQRELARIKATQYRQRIARYGRKAVYRQEPETFETWFYQGIERYKKDYGFTFELLTPGLIRIKRPGQDALLRTVADFKREYKEYLSKF